MAKGPLCITYIRVCTYVFYKRILFYKVIHVHCRNFGEKSTVVKIFSYEFLSCFPMIGVELYVQFGTRHKTKYRRFCILSFNTPQSWLSICCRNINWIIDAVAKNRSSRISFLIPIIRVIVPTSLSVLKLKMLRTVPSTLWTHSKPSTNNSCYYYIINVTQTPYANYAKVTEKLPIEFMPLFLDICFQFLTTINSFAAVIFVSKFLVYLYSFFFNIDSVYAWVKRVNVFKIFGRYCAEKLYQFTLYQQKCPVHPIFILIIFTSSL